jgi:hypothetical protein
MIADRFHSDGDGVKGSTGAEKDEIAGGDPEGSAEMTESTHTSREPCCCLMATIESEGSVDGVDGGTVVTVRLGVLEAWGSTEPRDGDGIINVGGVEVL